MAPDPRQQMIPVHLNIFIGFGILALLILAPLVFSWYVSGPVHAPPPAPAVQVKILAINDFHGQITPGQTLNKRPVGGIPVLASYLNAAMASKDTDGVIIALPGDVVGASPPESGLLLDEPALLFFNTYANPYCSIGSKSLENSCNMVATPGNHEFDKGIPELMRKINGGNGATTITHLVDPYPGSKTPYVCANVVWKANNTPVFPPYTLKNISGVQVAFIGADTTDTPRIQKSPDVRDLIFLDEAESINRYIPEIQNQGVHAMVVLLHEGGSQIAYEGPTQANGTVTGRVATIIPRLDSDIDVVLSGHTDAFINAYLTNAGGNPVLVTEAYNYGRAYADIDLIIDRATGEIVNKSARIIPTYANESFGTSPDPAAVAFLADDRKAIAPEVNRMIGVAAQDLNRDQTPAGESALGDLVADSQRAAMKTDVAFMNHGGVRAYLAKGNVTWGNLYSVQPFADTVLSMTLTGEEIKRVLEQQWLEPLPPKNLVVSGLRYTWDAARPPGSKVTDVKIQGSSLDPERIYTVSTVYFLAGGGDGYTTLREGQNITYGPSDVDALVAYVQSLPQPLNITTDGRIQRIN